VNLSVTEPINPALYSDGPIWVTSAEAVDTLFDDPALKKVDKVRHGIWFICIQNNIMCYISSCIFIYWLCHWQRSLQFFWQQLHKDPKIQWRPIEIYTSSLWSFYIMLIFIQFHYHLMEQKQKENCSDSWAKQHTPFTNMPSQTSPWIGCTINLDIPLYHSYLSWFKTQNMASRLRKINFSRVHES
jgi:hypothetical protein